MRNGEREARMPAPRVRFALLRGCLLIFGPQLVYLTELLFLAVWGPRYIARVGRGPALVSAAAAYAIILLALGANTLRVRPAPFSLRRWMFQYLALLLVLAPLLAFVVAATLHYGLWWASLGSFFGVFLALWVTTELMPWRRRGGMAVRDEREG